MLSEGLLNKRVKSEAIDSGQCKFGIVGDMETLLKRLGLRYNAL